MTAQYHDALDRFEAKQRAQQAEMCCCLELLGDNDNCPIHGLDAEECTCGSDPDAPACRPCRARNEREQISF